jgi:L-asparaginase II
VSGVSPAQFAPVAVIDRNGVDESIHFGAVVCLDEKGDVAHAVGDPGVLVYPRSSTKPLQALAMVRAGLDLPPEQLALVCASHNGEQVHLDTARAILAGAGLDESALGNTAGWPLHEGSQHAAIRDGIAKSSLQMNCSGKHSGMVATCVLNGWPLEGYLDPGHPLQQAITDTVPDVAGEEAFAVGVDGCGAPAHVISLLGLARAVRAMATGAAGESGLRIHDAMSNHSHIVGGTGRDVTAICTNVPGLMAKDGAEAVYVAALPDGRAVALKLSDGSGRGTATVLVAALGRLGVDVSAVPSSITETALGHGRPVGRIRALGFG